jgi:hypothetical protein
VVTAGIYHCVDNRGCVEPPIRIAQAAKAGELTTPEDMSIMPS